MRRIFSLITALMLIAIFAADCTAVCAQAESKEAVYADSLNDGEYEITVDSSSSMFRVVKCKLIVSGGKMTALMTMSGQGYGMLYAGTSQTAVNADKTEFIDFELNEQGQKTFLFPVEALDKETDCAAWSIRKEKWYDRKLVFRSDSLPENALRSSSASVIIVSVTAASVIIMTAIGIVIARKKRKGADE